MLLYTQKVFKMKNRNIQELIKGWDGLTNDDEMVEFIDSLTMQETALMDEAIRVGLLSKEPLYVLKEAAK